MQKLFWVGLVLLASPCAFSHASAWRRDGNELTLLNAHLKGKVVDHTANHGQDRRFWSRSLYQRRDLYVYIPPGFDPKQQYPLAIFLHGFIQDEHALLEWVREIDHAICVGYLPPLIIACPDGSVRGEGSPSAPGTFFLNTKLGDFQDYVTQDVWDFVTRHYPIRPEREAHILVGESMGGFAAYNIAMQHRYAFGIVAGIYPALNLRWVDDQGNYRAKFDPKHWGWRTEMNRCEIIARLGFARLHLIDFLGPVFGVTEEALMEISRENPIEMIDRTCLRNGELSMFVGYGSADEFNIDAQIESFLYLCKFRGLGVAVSFVPDGAHNFETARKILPDLLAWLAPQIEPYSPPLPGPERPRPPRRPFDNTPIQVPPQELPTLPPHGPICPFPPEEDDDVRCKPPCPNPCPPTRSACTSCLPNGGAPCAPSCLPGTSCGTGCDTNTCRPGMPCWPAPSAAPPTVLPSPWSFGAGSTTPGTTTSLPARLPSGPATSSSPSGSAIGPPPAVPLNSSPSPIGPPPPLPGSLP